MVCGFIKKCGKPCQWEGVCPYHTKQYIEKENERREMKQMMEEDKQSKALSRKVCGKETRAGGLCKNYLVQGECVYHPSGKRCASCLDTEPELQCKRVCTKHKHYCDLHEPFPNLGLHAAVFAQQCLKEGVAVDEKVFLHKTYEGNPMIHDWSTYFEIVRVKLAVFFS